MCGGCGQSLTGKLGQSFVVDHDHKTWLVRGVLCLSCNAREGYGDSALDGYRNNPPALQLEPREYPGSKPIHL
jgi:hypothetical protein